MTTAKSVVWISGESIWFETWSSSDGWLTFRKDNLPSFEFNGWDAQMHSLNFEWRK